ncbi:MAG: hypothetical protein K2Y32_18240 [Candidatus Obscuribacterales bacterium]|nr:hypothetical protein [Candidatus Obscuribacterales bacterium]
MNTNDKKSGGCGCGGKGKGNCGKPDCKGKKKDAQPTQAPATTPTGDSTGGGKKKLDCGCGGKK